VKHEASFEEIGKEIGCTTERARQIFEEGMEKIKDYLKQHPYYATELYMFLESSSRPSPQCPRTPEGDVLEAD
jgi:hypothetical protein